MIYKLPEPTIDETNPFKNCKLGRLQYADILTKVIRHNPGCVLAIDGEWGSGKTTFVKMWNQSLINQGFNVLYFNVWEHDFIADPIIGFISQFSMMVDNKNEIFKNFVAVAAKVTAGIFPAIVKSVTKKYLGEDVVEVIVSAAHTVTDLFEKSIEEYTEQCNSMNEFREALKKLVQFTVQDGRPLVFIVDELDRCNPHYAVKVLERIKHLFLVSNIVFVLSIDKKQLCNSICGYYGSEHLNAEEYLRRFIDVEYRLPEPDIEKFLEYLYEVYEYGDFFDSEFRNKYPELTQEKKSFIMIVRILFEYMHLNLRQMEKVCTHIRLVLDTFEANQYIYPDIILMLMCIRLTNGGFYNQIVNKSITVQELLEHIENIFPRNIFNEKAYKDGISGRIVMGIVKLIVAYNLSINGQSYNNLIESTNANDNSRESNVFLISPTIIPQKLFRECMEHLMDNDIIDNILSLDEVMQHIELLLPFK